MPRAPKPHRPAHQPQMQQQRRQQQDRWRGTAHSRGYTKQWSEYSTQLCRERIFCELCKEAGIETPIVRATGPNETGERRKIISTVDHIIPVNHGQGDPLFWAAWNHWCLCSECDRWKSATFDGGYAHAVREVRDRSEAGAAERRREVVRERWAKVIRDGR